MAVVQRALLIIKPDAMRKGIDKNILSDIHKAGLNVIVQKKISQVPEQMLAKLYEEHRGKPFYGDLLAFMASGSVRCAVVEGVDAVGRLRVLMGDTIPSKASPDSIRGRYKGGSDKGPSGAIENSVHGSADPERAKHEIELFFGKKWTV